MILQPKPSVRPPARLYSIMPLNLSMALYLIAGDCKLIHSVKRPSIPFHSRSAKHS